MFKKVSAAHDTNLLLIPEQDRLPLEKSGEQNLLERPAACRTQSWEEIASQLEGREGRAGDASPLFERGRALGSDRCARLLQHFESPSADWARLELAASAAMELIRSRPRRATHVELMTAVFKRLVEHGADRWGRELVDPSSLIQRLVSSGVLARQPTGQKLYEIAAPAEEVAFRLGDVRYFHDRLAQALEKLRDPDEPDARLELVSLLSRCARGAEGWPRYPVEARWPLLKAVALLSREDQEQLGEVLEQLPKLRTYPIIDATLLMLKGDAPETWVKDFAPHLDGSCVYTVAAEGWFAAGGLGRVQQYHSASMKKLVGDHARVATIEPYYQQTGQGMDIDYHKLVKDLAPLDTFEVRVDGQPVKAEVFRGTNEHGVEVYLIRDAAQKLTHGCYAYGKDGTGSWEDFTEFFSRASLELIRRLEKKQKEVRGDTYKPPAIIANDGQAAPLVPFFRQAEKADPLLDGAAVWMVTHTYKNRGFFQGQSGKWLLDRWQIPDELRADFLRYDDVDITSAGLRGADGASAVSAIHRDEVAYIDPSVELIAITNGDHRPASSRRFRELLSPAEDPDRPTPTGVYEAKRSAKSALGLNPDQLVIAYSGRLVWEKAGRARAFTDENIRELVRQGAQVVIYGNVQPNHDSEELGRQLEALKRQLEMEGHPGRLVFRPAFGLTDQVELLAAADLQVQDSDRATGAAEYTEADITANAGLQLGPPWIEGIIQRQGILLDREHPGRGNTLVPQDETPGAYLAAMLWALDEYKADPARLAEWQAASVLASWPLSALLPGAEYLRQLDRVLERRQAG